MRKLILIKHARPNIAEGVPTHEWELSDEGKRACAALAAVVARHEPAVIVTSDEVKAEQTGRLLAESLKVPIETAADLHEHDRSNVPIMPSRDFLSLLALFFKDRRRLVLGRETADEAADRFEDAIDSVVEKHSTGNIAVVTHGTVLALFAEEHGAGDAFGLYRTLGLPSVVVFTLPEFKLVEMIERIGG
jgi:broad specificity phosphatase PhoE